MRLSLEQIPFSFPVLVGDIGGTNARFWLIAAPGGAPEIFATVRTAEYDNIDGAIRAAILAKTDRPPRSAILAIAGPIRGDEIPLTNCPWVIRPQRLIDDLGIEDVLVVNDFEAQALAAAALTPADRQALGPLSDTPAATRVVLGPGTGLGVGGLVHARDTWFPVPGEGGHVDLGPRTDRDRAIFPHLEPIDGRISGEQVLCGRGLVNLYRAICKADGLEPQFSDPADVSARGLSGEDGVAAETLRLFSTYLGRLAGDLALIFMARGGVFLSGGISQKILPALLGPEFRAAFEDKAPHASLMRGIATFVVTHPQAALSGLADYASRPMAFGVSHEGRRWRR